MVSGSCQYLSCGKNGYLEDVRKEGHLSVPTIAAIKVRTHMTGDSLVLLWQRLSNRGQAQALEVMLLFLAREKA